MRRAIAAAVLGILIAITPGGVAYAADPVRDAQWHLGFLHVTESHQYSTGVGVIVAVIDSGVDPTHPDLAGSLIPGIDLTSEQVAGGAMDTDGHGTAMAGLIVAHGRAQGIAPDAKVQAVRIGLSRINTQAPAGIEWAIDHGAAVLCLALGGAENPGLKDLIDAALARDIVVVAAAGNAPSRAVEFPAAFPGVLAVAGVDQHGNHAAISVSGPEVVLSAPAVDIVSTGSRHDGDNKDYRISNGTSEATAIVAGAVALVRARFPGLSAEEVVHRLEVTADDKGIVGRDFDYGYGVINLVRALTADVPLLHPPATDSPSPTPAATARSPNAPWSTPVILTSALLALLLVGGAVAWGITRRRD